MKKLIKNKHWYTQNLDYSVDGNVYGYDKFWLSESDELIVRIARVYAVDEDAFTEYHHKKIN